ncbi:MAG: 2-amino-4-hydroxy-6-hydroxymethyldihydropteridine diphosphokinase [Candidatus Sulfotelmatobacter sp.]
MATLAYLSLGSNLGKREAHLLEAERRLGALGRVAAVSSFYETEPVEFTEQPWFLNCAAALETGLTPQELMTAILGIEEAMGRQRIQKKGPRIIDIDILLFGNAVLASAEVSIPHPAMHERRFVLEPLAEIAPEARHPVLNKTIRELREALSSGAMVRKAKNQATDLTD